MRRIIAFAALLLAAPLLADAFEAGASAAIPSRGTITVYFDSGHTRTELTDIAPGTPVAFYVVAEDVDPEGLSGFSFGVEVDASMSLLGLAATSGVAWQVDALGLGNTRWEAYASPGACIAPDPDGCVTLGEGFGVWLGPGANGETIIDIDAALRLDPGESAPTWFDCSGGDRIDFATEVDGRIGPSGGPECRLSTTHVRFGNVLTGNTVSRSFTVTNAGGDVLEGDIPAACGAVTVTEGAGPFSLSYGQVLTVDVELSPSVPGQVDCSLPVGTGCGEIIVSATVVDPAEIGPPAGVLSVYLNAALTRHELLGQTFGASHTVYVVAEGLPAGARVAGYEAAVNLDGFLVSGPAFEPPGSIVIAGGEAVDVIVQRDDCPAPDADGNDVLFTVTAPMVTPPDDYTVTIAPSGSSVSALDGRPVWTDCDGTIHPFAETRAARIQYTDPDACVRGPGAVDFGRVFTGNARIQTVTITNTGTTPASGQLTVDCSAFAVTAGALYSLAPHETHEATVRFAPTGAGEYGCALSGGPMCDAILLSGTGSAPRDIGPGAGTVSVYFDDDPATTELAPAEGLFSTVHVVASGLGAAGIDGFEFALTLPGDMVVVGGSPRNVHYDLSGDQSVVVVADLASCRAPDGQGSIELARLEAVYLPLFPRAEPFTVALTPVTPSIYDPPAPGWSECGGPAHPFAAVETATVLPWAAPVPTAPDEFTRSNDGDIVMLGWNNQPDASTWRLYRGDTPGFTPGRTNLVAEITSNTYSEVVPEPSRYHYRLSAVDAGGVGGPAVVSSDGIVAVAIADFTAHQPRSGAAGAAVVLQWNVVADENFQGFRVYRARDDGPVAAITDVLPSRARTFTDTGVTPGASYTYTLAALTQRGEVHSLPARVDVAPVQTALLGAFPNPFNPATTVAFTLSRAARARVDVFDAAGRHVTTLADGPFPAGRTHVEWDGRNRAGTPSASGVYFVRFHARGVTDSRKVILLK